MLNVNKEFYIFPISRNTYATSMCSNFDGQDDSIKMVIVVEINGKTYYYPYRALYVQPNSAIWSTILPSRESAASTATST